MRNSLQLERLQFSPSSLPILHSRGIAVSMSFYFTGYSLNFLRGKRPCISTLNRNKNVQEILRIGQKPAKTKL